MNVKAVQQDAKVGYGLLLDILQQENLYPHFQPIVNLKQNQVLGYEALIRGPAGHEMEMPDALFTTAIEHGLLHELELLCRKCSLATFAELKPGGKLFLNVSASLLSSRDHQQGFTENLLKKLNLAFDDIVIELSEQHPFDHQGLTRDAVEHYRRMGFKIAIDDLGAGYSGLKLWSDIYPDYVKIDRHFVTQVDRDPVKREFVRAICNISQVMGCQVIAEGIERPEELQTLQELGVFLGQGFLLGRPMPTPQQGWQPPCLPREPESQRLPESPDMTAFSLLRSAPALNPEDSLLTASELFHQHPELTVLPVLKQQRPLGMVRRSDLLELFSTPYGRALNEKKPVTRILQRDIIVVETFQRLADVSQQITDQESGDLQQELVIVQDGFYMGVAYIRDLLKQITDLKVQNAHYANPLTLLPGNVPLHREIDRRLKQALEFRVGYFDLNNFKPFNDSYGYAKGDQVIRMLGELLVSYASHSENFIGHIGGDDFVVIFGCPDWQQQCEQILRSFDQAVRDYYLPADLEQGGIQGRERNGQLVFFPLMGLAIGVVHPDPYRCHNHNEVAELAALAKKEAKRAAGSALFVDRRRARQ